MKLFFHFSKSGCLAIVSIFVIFIIDLAAPPDTSIGTLYIAGVLLSFNQSKRGVAGIACLATLAMVLDMLITVDLEQVDKVFMINKGISLSAIWVAALILMKYRQLYQYHLKEREERVQIARQVLFFTSHEIRRPICTLSGLMNLMYETKLEECEREIALVHLRDQVKELDECTRKLSDHMYRDNVEGSLPGEL
ncbi:MAG TPA: hypothetical protein VI112_15890 [Bacteroidia bacterium]|jgi:signal transduction histidine kinase